MSHSDTRTKIHSIDWAGVFPAVRLVSAFRLALQPGNLIVALVAVLILHFGGVGLDAVWEWGDSTETTDAYFDQQGVYREVVRDEIGVYEGFMQAQGQSFRRMISAAASLDFGLNGAGPSRTGVRGPGVLGSMLQMGIYSPLGLIYRHPGFAAIYGLFALVILSVFGGMICRMAATRACVDTTTSMVTAGRYVQKRIAWYVLTPMMPLGLMLVLGLVLFLAGLIFFNASILDVIGSLLYGPLLLIGFCIALIAIAFVFAVHLLTPALAVEGTDGFDAISRAMNYVMFRPWQLAVYFVAAAVYAAAVYLVVAGVAELTLGTTATLVNAGSFAESSQYTELSRFEAIQLRAASPATESSDDPWAGPWLVARWTELVWAIVAAIVFSLYFCLQTLVYLLIRRSADGTPIEECDAGDDDALWSTPADVIPQAAANDSTGSSDGA